MACPKCKGRGHINVGGRWTKCDCLLRERISSSLSASGICAEFAEEDDALNKQRPMLITKQFIAKLEQGHLPKMAPIYFSAHKCEYYAARYIEAAIKYGFSAQIINLSDLTDLYFNREQTQFSSLFSGPSLLGLRIGMELPNSVAAMILTNVLRTRRLQGKSTFIISTVHTSLFATRYNAEVSNMLKDTKLFVPVEVK